MKKKNILQLISLIMLSIAFVLLAVSMALHLIFGSKAWFSVTLAVISSCAAFIGCVIIIYSVKGDSDENKN